MFTTGSKLFFGVAVFAVAAAIAYAIGSSGGGELMSTWTLLALFGASAFLGGIVISFRDAEAHALSVAATSSADAEGLLASTPEVTPSIWPIVGAFGVGVVALGLVTKKPVFILGLIALGAVAIEWLVLSWADRASSDASYNRSIRNRFMRPVEFPVLAVLVGAIVVFGFSRVMLALPKNGSIVAFIIVAAVVFAVAVAIAYTPKVSPTFISVVLLLGGIAALTGGIVGAANGTRTFEAGEEGKTTNKVAIKSSAYARFTFEDGKVVITGAASGTTDGKVSTTAPRSAELPLLFYNKADGKRFLTVDARYNDANGKPQGKLFQSAEIGKDKSTFLVVRFVRAGSYPFSIEGEGGKTEGVIVVP